MYIVVRILVAVARHNQSMQPAGFLSTEREDEIFEKSDVEPPANGCALVERTCQEWLLEVECDFPPLAHEVSGHIAPI